MPSLLGFRHDVQGSRKVAKIAHLHLRLSNDILVHLYSSRPSHWDYFTVRRAKIAHLIAQKSTSAPLLNKPHDLRYHSCSKHKPCEMHNTPHLLFNTFFMQVVSKCFRREICECVRTVMCLFLDLKQNSFPSLCGIRMHKHSQMRCQHNTYP